MPISIEPILGDDPMTASNKLIEAFRSYQRLERQRTDLLVDLAEHDARRPWFFGWGEWARNWLVMNDTLRRIEFHRDRRYAELEELLQKAGVK